VIQIPSLGAQEHINIQFLSHTTQLVLLNVRSAEGTAQLIQVHLQRVLPSWIMYSLMLVLLAGAGFLLYWGVIAVVFLSHAIGIVK
jgi:hypothetical protein